MQYVPPARLLTMAEIYDAELAEMMALPRPPLIRQVAVQEVPPPAPLVRHDRHIGDEDLGEFAPMVDDEDDGGFAPMVDDEDDGGFAPMDVDDE